SSSCASEAHDGDEGDDALAELQRIARPVFAALGDEVLADAREEEIDFVAAVAFDRIGVEIELDEELDDRVVLPFEPFEKAADERWTDLLIGGDERRGCAIEREIRRGDFGGGVIHLRAVQSLADRLHPIVDFSEVDR